MRYLGGPFSVFMPQVTDEDWRRIFGPPPAEVVETAAEVAKGEVTVTLPSSADEQEELLRPAYRGAAP